MQNNRFVYVHDAYSYDKKIPLLSIIKKRHFCDVYTYIYLYPRFANLLKHCKYTYILQYCVPVSTSYTSIRVYIYIYKHNMGTHDITIHQ